MTGIRASGLSYTYPGGSRVGPLELRVEPGEVVVLTGGTGSGKSTLLRLLAGLLHRHGQGQTEGMASLSGRNPEKCSPVELGAVVGMCGQEPDDQLCTSSLGDEIAFSLASQGKTGKEAHERAATSLAAVGLDLPWDRPTSSLSGGQKQRLALAATLATGARCLLLDEPTSQLDPAGAHAVLATLRRLADEEGAAILLVEHRLEESLAIADRVMVVDQGKQVWEGSTFQLLADPSILLKRNLEVPGIPHLFYLLGKEERPFGWEEAIRLLGEMSVPPPLFSLDGGRETGSPLLHLEKARFDWSFGTPAVDGVEMTLHGGERVAVLGGNGAGKSTLLGLLAGSLTPTSGKRVFMGDPVGRGLRGAVRIPQNPDLALFRATVAEELAYGPIARGKRGGTLSGIVNAGLASFGLDSLRHRPPQALSRGQRLRTAVAAAAICAPPLLLLDEPTSGQDRGQVDAILAALPPRPHAALIWATHDVRLALTHASRVLVMEGGRIVADGAPGKVIAAAASRPDSALRLPSLVHLCAHLGHPALSAPDLALRLKGSRP